MNEAIGFGACVRCSPHTYYLTPGVVSSYVLHWCPNVSGDVGGNGDTTQHAALSATHARLPSVCKKLMVQRRASTDAAPQAPLRFADCARSIGLIIGGLTGATLFLPRGCPAPQTQPRCAVHFAQDRNDWDFPYDRAAQRGFAKWLTQGGSRSSYIETSLAVSSLAGSAGKAPSFHPCQARHTVRCMRHVMHSAWQSKPCGKV